MMITDSPTVVNCRWLEKNLYFGAHLIVASLTHEPIIK